MKREYNTILDDADSVNRINFVPFLIRWLVTSFRRALRNEINPLEREVGGGGGGGGGGALERTRIRKIPSTTTSTQIPNHKTTKEGHQKTIL